MKFHHRNRSRVADLLDCNVQAIVEFNEGIFGPKLLSTAIPEMLSTELAAGEKLRLIPGEDVARVKRELHLENAGTLARETAVAAGKNLKVDVLVVGSYTAMESASNRLLRVDLRLQDASNGEIVAEVAKTGIDDSCLSWYPKQVKVFANAGGL